MNSTKNTFEFVSYSFNKDQHTIEFVYSLTTPTQSRTFTEKIVLPNQEIAEVRAELLDHTLHTLHIMLGISYWKTYCPSDIQINTKPLTKDQATFWNIVYTKGLGEFFYKNKIDFRNLVSFPFIETQAFLPVSFPRKNRSLVGIGGGKDSIVTAELFKKHNKDFSTLIIDTQRVHAISAEIAHTIGKETIIIKRLVDPQLFELNKLPETFNGHIPVSAIYACIGILAALLYDYSYVVVSNERSANYGNTEYLGETINHQWSKTLEFEQLFQEYVKSFLTPDAVYFSLLRSLSEFKITQLFSEYTQYLESFSSCNRNYAIQKELPHAKWCGECPKCAFVFIMLSVFITKEKLLSIFGQNLLEKESLIHTYKELLGIEGVKPFECVGTPEEVSLAFYKIYKKGEYTDSVVMKMFKENVLNLIKNPEETEHNLLTNSTDLVPEEFKNLI